MLSARARLTFAAAVLAISLSACDGGDAPPDAVDFAVEFDIGSVVIETEADTFDLTVEVAESERQRSTGLMRRASLPPDEGMIFLFDAVQEPERYFWMYNTLIPLSIAFIGPDDRIGSIREMVPCTSPYPQWCEQYAAGVPFTKALEVNQGYFEERGIGIGDRVVLRR